MKRKILVISMALFCSIAIFAQKSPVFVADGAAIHGYDAVAYFKESKPVKGDKVNSYTWNGATWYFVNKENMEAFKMAPEKYAPQYGGYCAYGAADGDGHKAPTDPQAWKIVDGKLYFNYNKDVQQMWFKKQDDFIKVADKNWVVLKNKG